MQTTLRHIEANVRHGGIFSVVRDERGGTEEQSADMAIELQSLGLHCVDGSQRCIFSLQHVKANTATINPYPNPYKTE